MFHCSSRDEIVRASSELARSFAVIGLLRHVKEATPTDMICTYITRTNQSWGLISKVHEVNCAKSNLKYQMTVRDNHDADKLKQFPAGIVRMSKDYLIREFWKHIDHLRSSSCMRINNYCGQFGGSENGRLLRLFPNEVLKVLRCIQINQSSRIWDARNAIGSLHAVCTPIMFEKPNWLLSTKYGGKFDKTQFDVIRTPEERSLSALISVLDNYCWQVDNRAHIPNDAEKNILLDLIESLIVMFGCGQFAENFVLRQVYEYSRLQDSFGGRKGLPNDFSVYQFRQFDDRQEINDHWRNGVEMIIERLRHLSPEAAICTGYIGNNFWDSVLVNNPDILKAQTPQPYREVSLYLKAELEVQRQKKNYAGRVLEAIKKGEFDPSKISYSGSGDDTECEAPCGRPDDGGSMING